MLVLMMANEPERYVPIGDYALISDCHSAALVSSDGSIDWACLRRMDRDSTFARLLDHDRGGFFSIRPVEPIRSRSRRYLPGTMVLETTLHTDQGTLVITDAFAMRRGGSNSPRDQLLRRITSDGDVAIEIIIEPRFDFGSVRPWLRVGDARCVTAIGSDAAVVFDSDVDLQVDRDRGRMTARCTVRPDTNINITAIAQAAHRIDPSAARSADVADHLDETVSWWQTWSESTIAQGRHAALVERSALVLKALNCAPTGAIVAAPTTSLPETIGGDANWDYRYCWIRDATLALQALCMVGHAEVAQGFRDFVMRSSAGSGAELQIMYGCYGERRLPEVELDLEGWRGSRPVRIGNAAASQTQLDVYGQVLDAAHLWQCHTVDAVADDDVDRTLINDDEWRFLVSVVERAIDNWERPDSGIWELRGEPRHYVHSKVMVWVAIDRGVRFVEDHGVDHVDVDRWKDVRNQVRSQVEREGLDPSGSYFVQYYGAEVVDASLLKLPLVGFIDANDERMVATVDAIRRDLAMEPHPYLRRFGVDPNVAEGTGTANDVEGVFLLCTFWLVEVLALQNRIDEAEELFEQLLGLGNDLGLFAEEYDLGREELIGNFPQAFTHLGIISADDCLRRARAASS